MIKDFNIDDIKYYGQFKSNFTLYPMKEKHKRAYMKTAYAFAECSVSTRLHVGCVIVKNNRILTCGYNALPAHLHGSLEDEDGVTKQEARHAEHNALMSLIKSTESSAGSVLFVTHSPCYYCAVDIVDAGIVKVYYDQKYRCDKGLKHLREHGVEVERFNV